MLQLRPTQLRHMHAENLDVKVLGMHMPHFYICYSQPSIRCTFLFFFRENYKLNIQHPLHSTHHPS